MRTVYNAGEFSLFHQQLPTKTIHIKCEQCPERKFSKINLMGPGAANGVGNELSMLVIRKMPKCVKSLPRQYRSQKKS